MKFAIKAFFFCATIIVAHGTNDTGKYHIAISLSNLLGKTYLFTLLQILLVIINHV